MRPKRLEMLYRTLIKEHSQNPKNKRTLENISGEMELLNPACGDLVNVQFRLADNKIEEIAFEGHGCAISMASASLMTELMQGKSIEEVFVLVDLFSELVKGNEGIETEPLGDAVFLQGVAKFPTRIRCANLSWHALEEALKKFNEDQGDEGLHDE